MALSSKHFDLMEALAIVLNADADLSARNFRVRKKPYNRGKSWEPGGFVCPGRVRRKPHENSRNLIDYEIFVAIVDPKDADLTDGLEAHLGAMERIESMFDNHAHQQLPATIRAVGSLTGRIEMSKCEAGSRIVDGAFEAGYDASSCTITITTTLNRYLGAVGY